MRVLSSVLVCMLLTSFAPVTAQAQDGSIVAWGYDNYGQCEFPLPNSDFVSVAAGWEHSLGLKLEGSIVALGRNDDGQCVVPSPNADFVAIAAAVHSMGLKADGTIVAWGRNEDGQCNVPEPNAGFAALAAGYYHSLGLRSDGAIAAWGRNDSGQCNLPTPNNSFVAVAAGGYHNLGLRSDGTAVTWGRNDVGQCDVPPPNAGFVAIAGGGAHSLGLKANGSIVAWGSDAQGQCAVPPPNTGFVAIAAGWEHSLGLKSDGTIVAWGRNQEGQCDVPSPNTGFVAIGAGEAHTLGLTGIPGACCHPDGTCTLSLQIACQSPSTWEGAGTTCAPNPCSPTPVLLESWTASSLADGLQIRWEVPLGTTGALYRAWRDPAAGPHDVAPTPDAVLVSSAWISASSEGIIETLDRAAPRGAAARYFLEMSAGDQRFIGPIEARWDPPAPVWSVGPNPFRGTVHLTPPGTGPARAAIFDPAGRLVRIMVRADGNAPMEWDGRDDADHEVPAGIYMVRVGSAAGDVVARTVKLR